MYVSHKTWTKIDQNTKQVRERNQSDLGIINYSALLYRQMLDILYKIVAVHGETFMTRTKPSTAISMSEYNLIMFETKPC